MGPGGSTERSFMPAVGNETELLAADQAGDLEGAVKMPVGHAFGRRHALRPASIRRDPCCPIDRASSHVEGPSIFCHSLTQWDRNLKPE
jgi:hypothetical protein